MARKQIEPHRPDLCDPLTVQGARAAKNAVIRDLVVRAGLLRDSAKSGKHDAQGRNALLVAVRVLEVIIRDYTSNLGVED